MLKWGLGFGLVIPDTQPYNAPVMRGPHSTMDSVLASHPAAQGSNPGIPKVFSENFLDVNCCQVN